MSSDPRDPSPLRILHLAGSLDPARGGPPVVVAHLAAAQAALGHEVAVLAYDPPGERRRDAVRCSAGDAVRWRSLPSPDLIERLSGRAAADAVRSLVPELDVLHAHGVWEPFLTHSTRVARGAALPYVVAPHGLLNRWSLQQKRLKKSLALRLGRRRMLEEASVVHAGSAQESEEIGRLSLRAPCEVIPNGVCPEELAQAPPEGAVRLQVASLGDDPYVVFLGRLHHGKGLDVLAESFVRAAEQHSRVRLVVVGPDEGEGASFRSRLRQAGIEKRVHLLGPLYGREKLAALRDAACLCLPSRQESFGLVAVEALALGVPVIVSEACPLPEIESHGAGFVVPLDPGAVADAMLTLLSEPDRRARMSAAGRELALSRFTWPTAAVASIAVYRRFCRPITERWAGDRHRQSQPGADRR